MAAPDELEAMQALARRLWREAPTRLDLTVAELAYEAGIGAAAGLPLRLRGDDGRCRGWGRVAAPATLEWAVEPDAPGLLDEILDWFEREAEPGAGLRTSARNGDAAARETLARRGFVPEPGRPFMLLLRRPLDCVEEPSLPAGYRVRTVADHGGDLSKRVAVHRRAWAELGTRVAMGTYPGVTATPPYRADLDSVLEAADGTPAAFALAWYDEETGVGEFEPVGVDPAYRGRGLGRALLLDGLRRLRAAGADVALVGARGDDGHPAPRRLYASIGFRELSRQLPFVRPGGP